MTQATWFQASLLSVEVGNPKFSALTLPLTFPGSRFMRSTILRIRSLSRFLSPSALSRAMALLYGVFCSHGLGRVLTSQMWLYALLNLSYTCGAAFNSLTDQSLQPMQARRIAILVPAPNDISQKTRPIALHQERSKQRPGDAPF